MVGSGGVNALSDLRNDSVEVELGLRRRSVVFVVVALHVQELVRESRCHAPGVVAEMVVGNGARRARSFRQLGNRSRTRRPSPRRGLNRTALRLDDRGHGRRDDRQLSPFRLRPAFLLG